MANNAVTSADASSGSSGKGGWGLPLVVLVAGMFMSILDTSIVNVAILKIQNVFGATTDEVQWVATAYTLTLGVVVPLSAWLSDRFGASRIYNIALLAFAGGSALCGVAWSLDSLIVFRIVQAVPGGILPVVTLSMLYKIVPKEKLGAAMGMYGLGIIFAPAIGPTLGGYLVEYVDWRLIFFINVPVGVVGALAAVAVLPKFGVVRRVKFDWLGFGTIATGLFSMLLALTEGQDWGWTSAPTVTLLAVAVLSLALFVVIELEVDEPLLDVRVFRHWPFTNSLLLISMLSVGLFAVLFYVPLFLQQAQGMGAFEAGVLLLPQALIMAVCMPLAGRLYDRIGPRWPAVAGLAIVSLGTWLLRDLSIDTPHWEISMLLMLRAAGMGMAMMPVMTSGIAAVPPTSVNTASAFNNVVQRTAASLGLAILTAVLTGTQAQLTSDRAGLMTDPTALPSLGPGQQGRTVGMLMSYQRMGTQVFVQALDNLMVITTIISLVAVALAFMLRSGPLPKSTPPAAPPKPAPAEAVDDRVEVGELAVETPRTPISTRS